MRKETETTKAGERTQHTQGPWATDIGVETYDGAKLDCVVYVNHGSGKGGEICRFVHDPSDGLDVEDPETIANARLIAAAPVLLEACRKAAVIIGSDEARFKESIHEAVIEVLSEINAAIASAEWK